ncbi:carbohydrate-binding module family 13 protein [Athelia psychrophila]|uniref:Carbohydrate-binding module family 13 protein n=1 Tax=Athelia psychrophila TaxID=1759441 RepID=A0A166MGS3_9AGAM|nr:carbohydrate-binding module family 13 protein [Fibularhizoctonia sp. CBS 109695]
MHFKEGQTYKITNVKASDRIIDLSGGDNKSLIGYQDKNGPNQRWILEKAQDNAEWWLIKSAGSGKYINLDEGKEARDGVPLIAGDKRFAWDIKPDTEHKDHYRFFVPNTEFNFDLADHGSEVEGSKVQLWSKTRGKGQTWILSTD